MRILITLFTISILSIYGKAQGLDGCEVSNSSFRDGEMVIYVLSYTWGPIWVDVGEAKFTVTKTEKLGQDALHLHALGTTYQFYNWFYEVYDVYESWVDTETLRPIYFNRDINEGGYTKENEYRFDWENKAIDARIRRRGGANQFLQIPLERCSYDVVSAIYLSRNLDFRGLKPNAKFPITVVLDRENFDVSYVFLARETKRVKGLGTFRTLKFQVELIAGDVFKGNQVLYVWVTDDLNRVPIYIESPIRVGSVRARVSSWEGLRYPVGAEVR